MFKASVLAAACVAACSIAPLATAADAKALAHIHEEIRDEIRQLRATYEARIAALEARLQQAATPAAAPAPALPVASAASVASAAPRSSGANTFNPAVSLILGGTYTNLSQDPNQFRLQGFMPGGEIGPGARSFNLGESELTLAASIDPRFNGRLTFALAPDNSVGVEEAYFATSGLSNGLNVRAGRFLSGLGYLNGQHAHTWDFVDAPLAYQAFLGGQYKSDGVQARWLAPTERFLEVGVELGNGAAFPGNERNKNGVGASAVFAHLGDDIGESASWRTGVSYLRTGAHERAYDDVNSLDQSVMNAFSGKSHTWVVDGIFKWAPNGNATQRNLKLQGEYFQRKESGTLASAGDSGSFMSRQSGWYAQGVYQFMPAWRVGVRHDRLHSGTPVIGLVSNGTLAANDFQRLASYQPQRNTLMMDYSPSEFSRFRLQFARDKSRPEASDAQIYLQYIMSLGAHGAHAF